MTVDQMIEKVSDPLGMDPMHGPAIAEALRAAKHMTEYLDQFMIHRIEIPIVRYEDVLMLLVSWDAATKKDSE